jgi:hypothetical protein
MIFNQNTTPVDGLSNIQESQYELGLEGALMHVYENECNYNAIIKSVGLSELRYYQETGKDLFVHEAGAFNGYVEKVKKFFQSVIEKIKAIFKKFAATMAKYTMSDKDFVKKYKDQALRNVANAKDFKVSAYTFEKLDDFVKSICSATTFYDRELSNINDATGTANKDVKTSNYSSDDISAEKDKLRGKIVAGTDSGSPLDSAEFREELKKVCYGNDGDKEDVEIDTTFLRTQFEYIENTKNDIKAANDAQKKLTDAISKIIKGLDALPAKYAKIAGATDEKKAQQIKYVDNRVDIVRAASNDYTAAFGAAVGALKARNRQAKAIAVKALSYKAKNEATYSESSVDDIFASVVIR